MSSLELERISKSDIRLDSLSAGGTAIVLQRHGAYERNRDITYAGSIHETAARETFGQAHNFFDTLYRSLSRAEQQRTYLFCTASPTRYANGQRAIETTLYVQAAALSVMHSLELDPKELVLNYANHSRHGVHPEPLLQEPNIFSSPAYIAHLQNKYGLTEDGNLSRSAWEAHENDVEQATRLECQVEGTQAVVTRLQTSIQRLAKLATDFHQSHPQSRLVIWAGTHYDLISPYAKALSNTPNREYVAVEHGGGMVLHLPNAGEAYTLINRQRLAVPLGSAALNIRW